MTKLQIHVWVTIREGEFGPSVAQTTETFPIDHPSTDIGASARLAVDHLTGSPAVTAWLERNPPKEAADGPDA